VGKPEGKRPLGRPGGRCEGHIKMDLREIRWGSIDWIDLVQDSDRRRALVYMKRNIRGPLNFGKFLSSCATGGFSRRAQLHAVS
jgi:hypothetical protein